MLENTSEQTEENKTLIVTNTEISITNSQNYDNDSLDDEPVETMIQVQSLVEPQTEQDKLIPEKEKITVTDLDLTGAVEERDFFRLQLGNKVVFALCDQGSQKSYIH